MVRILTFSAFVELAPGKDGMVHISKLADHRVEKVEDVVNVGDMIWVKVTEIDEKGRVNLSHKDALKEIKGAAGRQEVKGRNKSRAGPTGPARLSISVIKSARKGVTAWTA